MSQNYGLVRVKRGWVPEWLWRLLGLGLPPAWRPVVWLWPLAELLTVSAPGREEDGDE